MPQIIPGEQFESVLSVVYLGKLIDADADPVITIWRGAIATSIPVAVSRVDVGQYAYSWDVPSAWKEGDRITLEADYSVANQPRNTGNQLLGVVYTATPTDTPTPTPTPTTNTTDLCAQLTHYNRLRLNLKLTGCDCNDLHVGDTVRLDFRIWDNANQEPYNLDDGISTLEVVFTNESGTTTTLTQGTDAAVVLDDVGTYHLEHTWIEPGTHKWGVRVSGTASAVEIQNVYVSPAALES